jgi:lipopolysaccharide transport system ATP-binding protein
VLFLLPKGSAELALPGFVRETVAGRHSSFDGVIIGGGHLIRFDKDVAPGYFPPSPEMHHPTSYWLIPALLAIEAKVPLIWSAVGASPQLPVWGCEILREVLRASTYVSVRDTASQGVLQELTCDREVLIVPDSVFGIQALHLEHQKDGDHRDLGQRYVVIQATPNLKGYADSLQRLILWLRRQKYEVVLLPISPALGDDPETLRGIVGGGRPWRGCGPTPQKWLPWSRMHRRPSE